MKEPFVITKKFQRERNKYLKHAVYAGVIMTVTHALAESKVSYDEKNGKCNFVLASKKDESEEQLLVEELNFFQTMIDKIFGKSIVRLTKTIENDGSSEGKLTECTIEDGDVTEWGIIGRTNRVFIEPALADIAYYVVTTHNNTLKKKHVDVKQYVKIKD